MPRRLKKSAVTIPEKDSAAEAKKSAVTIPEKDSAEEDTKEALPIPEKRSAAEDTKEALPIPEKRSAVEATKEVQTVGQGKSQMNGSEYTAAIDTLTQILAVHPRDYLSYRLRGNAYDNLGDQQKAIEDWTKAARLGDSIIQSYLDSMGVKWRENPKP